MSYNRPPPRKCPVPDPDCRPDVDIGILQSLRLAILLKDNPPTLNRDTDILRLALLQALLLKEDITHLHNKVIILRLVVLPLVNTAAIPLDLLLLLKVTHNTEPTHLHNKAHTRLRKEDMVHHPQDLPVHTATLLPLAPMELLLPRSDTVHPHPDHPRNLRSDTFQDRQHRVTSRLKLTLCVRQ